MSKKDTSLEAICTIFEKLNNTGVRLTVFDLLTARFYPHGINLRELWEKAKKDYPNLEKFEIDSYQLLQSISALTTTNRVTRNAVLEMNLGRDQFNDYWGKVCKAMSDVVALLQEECGVLSQKWLPYSTMLVTLTTMVYSFPIDKSLESARHKNILKKWFWVSCFSQRYQRSPLSQISFDIPKLTTWLQDDEEYLTLDDRYISEDVIRSTTRSQRAVYRAIMCAIVSNGSKDFHTSNAIDFSVMRDQKINDHHIFPIAFLSRKSIDQDQIDSVVNRTLIDATTNMSIGDNAPSQYLKKIKNSRETKISEQIFDSHLINHDAMIAMQNDDFEEFCKVRVKLIRERLRELME